MTDCSAKASELRKTCGNCLMYDDEKAQCDYFVMEGGEEVHERRSPEDGACKDWEKLELSLEQRCKQLEQVARDMWRYVVAHNTPDVPGIDMTEFGDRLEALGVSLGG